MKRALLTMAIGVLTGCAPVMSWLFDPVQRTVTEEAPHQTQLPAVCHCTEAPRLEVPIETKAQHEQPPTTRADDIIDGIESVGGLFTGDYLGWGLIAQVLHLGAGAITSRRRKPDSKSGSGG